MSNVEVQRQTSIKVSTTRKTGFKIPCRVWQLEESCYSQTSNQISSEPFIESNMLPTSLAYVRLLNSNVIITTLSHTFKMIMHSSHSREFLSCCIYGIEESNHPSMHLWKEQSNVCNCTSHLMIPSVILLEQVRKVFITSLHDHANLTFVATYPFTKHCFFDILFLVAQPLIKKHFIGC